MSDRLLGPHVLARIFDRPLMIHPDKARAILVGLLPRLGAPALFWNAGEGGEWRAGEVEAPAAQTLRDQQLAARSWGDRCFNFDAEEGIALIDIEGTLVHKLGTLHMYSGQTGYDGLGAQMRMAMSDPAVKGILLDVHSLGGEVAGCFDLADEILRMREEKPIWAIANDDALSAAYALACSAGNVIATRTAEVGSIGVWTMHIDWSGALEQEGIVVTPVFAGERKIDGWPYKPLPDDVRKRMQARIDDFHTLFIDHVAAARGLTANAVRETKAESLPSTEGQRLGLVDEIASFGDTYELFAQQLNDAA